MFAGIEKINFGHISAEEESTNLQSYFIETNEYASIKSDPHKILVIGRKGSGKSAINIALRDSLPQSDNKNFVESLSLQDYPWAIHEKIRDIGVPEKSAYINSWKYIILILLAKRVLNYNNPKQYQLFDKFFWKRIFNENTRFLWRFLTLNYGSISPSLSEIIADRARNARSLTIEKFSIQSSESKTTFEKLSDSINVVLRELEPRILNHLPVDDKYFLLFDQLDVGWDNSNESKNLIIGLILAARDIVRAAEREKKKVHIVLFLRSDIFETLQFEDKNKLSPDMVELKWNEQKLQDLVNKRILVSANGTWEDAFTNEPMRQQVTQFGYIVRRTMLRPRDLIQYCIYAKDSASRSVLQKIDKASIYAAERPYSEYMRKEIQDETQALPISIDDVFRILQEIHVDKFKKDEFLQKCQEKNINGDIALRNLIDLNIIGIYKAGGQEGGSAFIYKYQAQTWDKLEPSVRLAIHPSLKYVLSLIESRSSHQKEQNE